MGALAILASRLFDGLDGAVARQTQATRLRHGPEGVAEVEQHHPGTVIHTAALDRQLNDRKYILPGLGDFGDRLYGT